jgi:predicted dehydrogenase
LEVVRDRAHPAAPPDRLHRGPRRRPRTIGRIDRSTQDDAMSGPVRVAIVGYGLGGRVFHAPLVASVPEMDLVSIVTGNPERAEAARARYPGVRVVPDVDSLLGTAADHDLVVVATPNRFHVPISLAAMDAGLHVVVDKPLAPSAAEAKQAVAAAGRAQRLFTVFQNRRLDGDFLTVRRLVERGALGPIVRFESRFERWRPTVDPTGWRELGAPEEGGGLLLDLGAHLVDQAVRLFGPPRRVYAEVDRRRDGAAIDDDAFVALTHDGGVRSHLWMSAVAGSLGPRFRVLGLGGAYEKEGLDPQEGQLDGGAMPGEPGFGVEPPDRWGALVRGERSEPVETVPGDYRRFYADVADAVRNGAPPPVDPEDAVRTLEILEAAARSSASGAVVSLR